jgi:hypothetical protein
MPQPASKPSIEWTDTDAKGFRRVYNAERVATVALDRAAWEALGARFHDGEDPIGGVTRLAEGEIRKALGHDTLIAPFGVVDHGSDTTYLVAAHVHTDIVLAALVEAGVSPDAVLERLPAAAPGPLEDRVAALESLMHNVLADPELREHVVDPTGSLMLDRVAGAPLHFLALAARAGVHGGVIDTESGERRITSQARLKLRLSRVGELRRWSTPSGPDAT